MAVMEALRKPKDFDGIISGAPALDYAGLVATFFAWVTKANTGRDGNPIFPASKVKLLGDAVYAACAEKGVVKDGIVADPRACYFKPSVLECRAGDASDCLMPDEVSVVEKWYRGPTDSAGRQLYPGGIPFGSEPHRPRWLTSTPAASASMPLFAQDFLRYMAFQPAAGPSLRVSDFDFDRDPQRLGAMAIIYNATTFDPSTGSTDPGDLNAFPENGGKLVMYHGWANPLVTPQLTVNFYESVIRKYGGGAAAQDFARLVHGARHGSLWHPGQWTGIPDTGIDPLTALERWSNKAKHRVN